MTRRRGITWSVCIVAILLVRHFWLASGPIGYIADAAKIRVEYAAFGDSSSIEDGKKAFETPVATYEIRDKGTILEVKRQVSRLPFFLPMLSVAASPEDAEMYVYDEEGRCVFTMTVYTDEVQYSRGPFLFSSGSGSLHDYLTHKLPSKLQAVRPDSVVAP